MRTPEASSGSPDRSSRDFPTRIGWTFGSIAISTSGRVRGSIYLDIINVYFRAPRGAALSIRFRTLGTPARLADHSIDRDPRDDPMRRALSTAMCALIAGGMRRLWVCTIESHRRSPADRSARRAAERAGDGRFSVSGDHHERGRDGAELRGGRWISRSPALSASAGQSIGESEEALVLASANERAMVEGGDGRSGGRPTSRADRGLPVGNPRACRARRLPIRGAGVGGSARRARRLRRSDRGRVQALRDHRRGDIGESAASAVHGLGDELDGRRRSLRPPTRRPARSRRRRRSRSSPTPT